MSAVMTGTCNSAQSLALPLISALSGCWTASAEPMGSSSLWWPTCGAPDSWHQKTPVVAGVVFGRIARLRHTVGRADRVAVELAAHLLGVKPDHARADPVGGEPALGDVAPDGAGGQLVLLCHL